MRDSRTDEAYRHLVDYIERDGGVTEGSRLPAESEFVDQLGLSRTSIREALARLHAEGRTVSRRGAGTFVVRPQKTELVRLSAIDSIGDVSDWHEFRVAMESEVAALSAERRTRSELAAMRRSQSTLMKRLATATGETEDAAFHHSIAAGSHNPKLLEAVRSLTSHILRWAAISRAHNTLTLSQRREIIAVEHGDIIAAIAASDADAARAAARRHLLNGRARLLSSLRR